MVYKHVVCETAILFLLLTIATTTPVPNSNNDHYDQRQKGGDNYRLNWDGIVIAGGPAELFSDAISASDIDIVDLLEELNEINTQHQSQESKPEETPLVQVIKPQETKPVEAALVPDVKDQESKPENTPLNEISLKSETKSQREDFSAPQKPVKGQRLKSLLANFIVPLLRRHKE